MRPPARSQATLDTPSTLLVGPTPMSTLNEGLVGRTRRAVYDVVAD
jgi:hypothetical protein